jgi:hypothetical protein
MRALGEQKGACRDIAARGFASTAVGWCYEVGLCVDIREQTGRREAGAAGKTTPGITAPAGVARTVPANRQVHLPCHACNRPRWTPPASCGWRTYTQPRRSTLGGAARTAPPLPAPAATARSASACSRNSILAASLRRACVSSAGASEFGSDILNGGVRPNSGEWRAQAAGRCDAAPSPAGPGKPDDASPRCQAPVRQGGKPRPSKSRREFPAAELRQAARVASAPCHPRRLLVAARAVSSATPEVSAPLARAPADKLWQDCGDPPASPMPLPYSLRRLG